MMYLIPEMQEKNNVEDLTQVGMAVKADPQKYIHLLFELLEDRDPQLKKKISRSLVFQERQLIQYIKKVSELINNLTHLKQLFRLIGAKYLNSQLNFNNLNQLGDSCLQGLEIYFDLGYSEAIEQKLYSIYQTILEEILAGARDKYSLWYDRSKNSFTSVKRMKIEAVIKRTLAKEGSNEELVASILLKNEYFQVSLQKIGKPKTLEIIASAIATVNRSKN